MGVFVGTGFWLLVGFIAYGLHQGNALNNKIIVGLLIGFWLIGTFVIGYYYIMGDYLYHNGKAQKDCGIIIYPDKPLTARQQRKSVTNRITIQSSNIDKKYRFRYIDDYYTNKLSFNGFKKGDSVCFEYVNVETFANGYPYWLKSIRIANEQLNEVN